MAYLPKYLHDIIQLFQNDIVRTGRAVGSETSIPTAFARHPNAKSLVSMSRLYTLGRIPAYLITPLPPPHCALASPSFPSHLDSPSRLNLERPITPHFTKQPRPSDCPSRQPTPLVRAAPKKLPTDTVFIMHSPLQVGHWSGLLSCLPYPVLYLDKDFPFPFSRSPFYLPFP